MIGSLEGFIDHIDGNSLIINVRDVGYLVYAPICKEIEVGKKVKLSIKTLIKENSFDLYGFVKADQILIFNELIKINGIGPKIAITILSLRNPDEIQNAVESQDISCFKSIVGIGAKMASKILSELKDKKIIKVSKPPIFYESIYTLEQFGLNKDEAESLLNSVMQDPAVQDKKIDVSTLVTLALQARSKNS